MSKLSLWQDPSTSFKESKLYEIVLYIKDAKGNPTKKRKSYATDNPYKLWQFWMRHQGKPKRRRSNKIPTAQEAEKILKEMNKDKDE